MGSGTSCYTRWQRFVPSPNSAPALSPCHLDFGERLQAAISPHITQAWSIVVTTMKPALRNAIAGVHVGWKWLQRGCRRSQRMKWKMGGKKKVVNKKMKCNGLRYTAMIIWFKFPCNVMFLGKILGRWGRCVSGWDVSRWKVKEMIWRYPVGAVVFVLFLGVLV